MSLRFNDRSYSKKSNSEKSSQEFGQEFRQLSVLRDKAFKDSFEKLAKSFGNDFLVSNIISMIDDSQKALNTSASRMFDLTVVMLPELAFEKKNFNIVANALNVCRSIDDLKNILGLEIVASSNTKVLELAKLLANIVLDLNNFLNKQQALLDDLLSEHAPCLKAVAGSKIAARLLKQAGSLRNLALMPASKIQVLGAEKALFKHLTKHSKPPKHGFIAQHNLMFGLDRGIKGKAARIIAEHVAIAARADYFHTATKPELLSEKLLAEIRKLKAKK